MIEFTCDYAEGALDQIMESLLKTNRLQTPGYGEDNFCKEARTLIQRECGMPEAEVHFLVGGTQANLTVISSLLRPHQGVLAAESGHIAVHETGAIEACGHKVLILPSSDGKISAEQVKEAWEAHRNDSSFEHMVQPKVVYISQPTEWGTLYSEKELEELYETCRENGLYLYLDGARLAYGLTAKTNTLSLKRIAQLCDVFYIGGTKCGALFGEAVVIPNVQLGKDFRYLIKQKGGLLAKGRLLGIQFAELFREGLYYEAGRHGNEMAELLENGLKEAGYSFYIERGTNQLFPILKNEMLQKIGEQFTYSVIMKGEMETVVRFCTSWATKKEDVKAFIRSLKG